MGITDYDWNKLYQTAEDFLRILIPDAKVNRGTQAYFSEPRVEFSFMAKGNKPYIDICKEKKYIRMLRGYNTKNGKIIRAELIFDKNGNIKS